jgi:uncharacterized protein YacL (UPF0231 family)
VAIKMTFYRNGDGNLQVESEASASVIGRFLIEDIQDSPATCREVLGAIEGIVRGEMGSWRRVGNAHTLILSKTGAVIESLFESAEKPCRRSLADFGEIVERWLHFLEVRQ